MNIKKLFSAIMVVAILLSLNMTANAGDGDNIITEEQNKTEVAAITVVSVRSVESENNRNSDEKADQIDYKYFVTEIDGNYFNEVLLKENINISNECTFSYDTVADDEYEYEDEYSFEKLCYQFISERAIEGIENLVKLFDN